MRATCSNAKSGEKFICSKQAEKNTVTTTGIQADIQLDTSTTLNSAWNTDFFTLKPNYCILTCHPWSFPRCTMLHHTPLQHVAHHKQPAARGVAWNEQETAAPYASCVFQTAHEQSKRRGSVRENFKAQRLQSYDWSTTTQ